MKLKQTMQYTLKNYLRSSLIFYLVIALLFLATFILRYFVFDRQVISIGGMESASVIFAFVVGLNSFKTEFKLYIQSGISRRTLWVSFFASAMVLSVAMTLITSLYPLLFGNSLGYVSAFSTTYFNRAGGFSFVSLMWTLLSHFAALSGGFFLTTLYYRMNKPLKVAVSVGVPALLFVVLPLVEVFVPSFNLFSSLLRFYTWAMGLDFVNGFVPWRAVGSMAVFSCAMGLLTWLLTRRVTFKEA